MRFQITPLMAWPSWRAIWRLHCAHYKRGVFPGRTPTASRSDLRGVALRLRGVFASALVAAYCVPSLIHRIFLSFPLINFMFGERALVEGIFFRDGSPGRRGPRKSRRSVSWDCRGTTPHSWTPKIGDVLGLLDRNIRSSPPGTRNSPGPGRLRMSGMEGPGAFLRFSADASYLAVFPDSPRPQFASVFYCSSKGGVWLWVSRWIKGNPVDPSWANASLINQMGKAYSKVCRRIARRCFPLYSTSSMSAELLGLWSVSRSHTAAVNHWDTFFSIAQSGKNLSTDSKALGLLDTFRETAARNADRVRRRSVRPDWFRSPPLAEACASGRDVPLGGPSGDGDPSPLPEALRPSDATGW